MSVHGEFQRITSDLVRFLRGTQHAACVERAAALERNADGARDDLSAAAERARALCSEATPDDLAARHAAEYRERAEHLVAICRSIAGDSRGD